MPNTKTGTRGSKELGIKELGIKEIAAMLALMADSGWVSNPDLEKRVGFTLVGDERRNLNNRNLVDSRRQGQAFAHQLTPDGWDWCRQVLLQERPERVGSAGGALFVVLAGLARYLERTGLGLRDVFQPGTAATHDLEATIRTAYRSLATQPRAWVSLTQLRALLDNGATKTEVDNALRRMNRTPSVNIMPQSNQKVLSTEDRAAMVRIGGEDKLLICIEDA
jgi:hypothetical protein